ncbi:MAG: RdgB/HAM1 family non-canonical purine NTP pyrophosphatase, partial [Oscillospiraceae bacterium]|nr:RdgB/HAM1 family non-canonical purine NTP pyrophosphatase [Oscillospiraceae bacterium]
TGETFLENAMLKARAICNATGLPAIADDSGLMVYALDGAPGVYSSSYGGSMLTDGQRCEFLLSNMQNEKLRKAKFVCTIVCAFPDGNTLVSDGECLGEIISAPRGTGGFGYDPIFLVKELNKTMAELSSEEKNYISHRGKALRKFASLLRERSN